MVQGELEMKSEVATIFPVPIMIFDLKGHKENDKLLEMRDWLIPNLINGKITVN